MVEYRRFVASSLDTSDEHDLAVVDSLAEQLVAHLEAKSEDLARAHIHGASSLEIQKLTALLLLKLQFGQEVVFPPGNGLVVRPRPDFVFPLPSGHSVIAEVERGGTTTNNHDLKDMWKAHISPDAKHLFLVVPMHNWKADGTPREKVYPAVIRRIGAFFGDPRREIDVVSAHVFGY